MKIDENIIKKTTDIKTFDDLQKTALFLAYDICNFLSEEIEELNVYSYVFKSGIERALLRVLAILEKQDKPVVIFPDAIPGFTLMVFKKNNYINISDEVKDVKRSPSDEIKEIKVLDNVINRYFVKNQQKVIVMETGDLLFGLFPVADTRKHLKEMELYITF